MGAMRRLDETILRLGGVGDNWHMTWACDDKQYTSLCDGRGFAGLPQADYNSRCFAVTGEPPGVGFEYLPGYPDLLSLPGTRDISRYYNFGILALGRTIYQWLSTPNVPFFEPGPRFCGCKLIYSPDLGATWHNQDGSTPVVWEPWEQRDRGNMLFFDEGDGAFALITILQYGRDYAQNSDGFVYLYAPNGNSEGTMNQLVLARVRREHLLDRAAYEFYAGGREGASWSPRIDDRAPVQTFASGWVNRHVHPYAWHPSVVWVPARSCYLMANWGMGCDADGMWFGKPSYLGFWTAEQPWGPWEQVHEEEAWTPGGDAAARCYQPQIAPKWLAPDGRSFWLVWTDFQLVDGARPHYAFNLQRVEWK